MLHQTVLMRAHGTGADMRRPQQRWRSDLWAAREYNIYLPMCRALRRKVGGTAKDYWKDWVDVQVRLAHLLR